MKRIAKKIQFELNYKIVSNILFGIVGFLVFCHILSLTIFDWSWQWEKFFNLDFENNIPTWFSGFLWLGSAIVSFLISSTSENLRKRILWFSVSLFFLYLGCDEVAVFHERLAGFIYSWIFGYNPNFNGRNWALILPPLAIIFCFGISLLLREDFKTHLKPAVQIAIGFFIFILGAAGFDFLTGILVNIQSLNRTQRFMIIAEELLEMSGSILILLGLLEFLNARNRRLRYS